MLRGYKTYIVGIVAILGAVAEFMVGNIGIPDTLQLVLTAVLGMTLRNGVKTETEK